MCFAFMRSSFSGRIIILSFARAVRMECGEETIPVREIKQEAVEDQDDPDTVQAGDYQVVYFKDEMENDDDSKQDGGSSTESVGNPSFQNWDSGWQLPEEDEGEDSSEVTHQPEVTMDNEMMLIPGQDQDVTVIDMGDAPMSDPSDAGGSAQEEEEEVEAYQPVRGKQRSKVGKRRCVFLTESQKEEVIQFLIKNEGIYNRRKELWMMPHKKNKLWRQQGRAMGMDWKDLHTWYETQRRRLGRLRLLANKSGSGSIEETWKETDLEFWHRWQFLRSHINIQSQKYVVSHHRKPVSAPAQTRDLDAKHTPDEVKCIRKVQSATCRNQTTPNSTSHSTPATTGHSTSTTVGQSTPVSTPIQSTRSSNTNNVEQFMEAMASRIERQDQLINLSETLLRSQQVPAGQSMNRHQFILWCGSLLQELPQDLYEQCEADLFRMMTHYRKLAHQCSGQTSAAPPQTPQQYYNQGGWHPYPSNQMSNPPAGNSALANHGSDSQQSLHNSSLLHNDQLFAPPQRPNSADMATAQTADQ